jgi:excisionase family DNA binding protein
MTKLLTPQEAADYLRVKVSFIYERTRNNAIPLRRVGKFIRIPQDELIAWLDEQTAPCTHREEHAQPSSGCREQ